jgi:hypothetical protein
MQTTNQTPAPYKVRIVWVRDLEYDVYHDADLVEHMWMENDGRWYFCPTRLAECRAIDAQYAAAEAFDAKWAEGQADWLEEDCDGHAELCKAALSRGQP